MIPFFGHGDEGKERGVKLALASGIKESLYDEETLASYLLYTLWRVNPQCTYRFVIGSLQSDVPSCSAPAYNSLLGNNAMSIAFSPTFDFAGIMDAIARRMGAIRSGGELDLSRTAHHVVRWWREGKHLASPTIPRSSDVRHHQQTAAPSSVRGWGLDFYFGGDEIPITHLAPRTTISADGSLPVPDALQEAMDETVDAWVQSLEEKKHGIGISANQEKKREREEKQRERERKRKKKNTT